MQDQHGLAERLPPTASLVDDSIFKYFYQILTRNDPSALTIAIATQHYPDPVELLQHIPLLGSGNPFESGRTIDYQALQHDIVVSRKQVKPSDPYLTDIYKTCQQLLHARLQYAGSAWITALYAMYEKLIDRLYEKLPDPELLGLLRPYAKSINHTSWPEYEALKTDLAKKLASWEMARKRAYDVLMQFKGLVEVSCAQKRLREAVIRIQKRQGQILTPQEAQLQRKRDIEARNRAQKEDRAIRNAAIKHENMASLHQAGNQGRMKVGNPFIIAFARSLKLELVEMYHDDRKEDIQAYREELESQGIGPGMVSWHVERYQDQLNKIEHADDLDIFFPPQYLDRLAGGNVDLTNSAATVLPPP